MSDRNTDFDDLNAFDADQTGFGGSGFTDEIDLTPSEVITSQGGRNTRFIALASVLALLTLLGAAGIISLAVKQSIDNSVIQSTAVAVYATNATTPIFAQQTRTAIAQTNAPKLAVLQTPRLVESGLRLLGAVFGWTKTNGRIFAVPLANLGTLTRTVKD